MATKAKPKAKPVTVTQVGEPFRRRMGYVINQVIPKDGWRVSLTNLAKSGHFDMKTIQEMLTEICMELERNENK